MAYIDNVKNWFKTGLKPTQDQFYAKFAWLRWKDEKIPLADINDIEGILNAKAEAAVLTDHLTSATAHADEFNAKEDKVKKGQANGYVPLNEVVKIASQFLNIIDDVVSGGSDGLLSAEQGKVLNEKIEGINIILASDDINLDTLQEIVDAIKDVDTYLETIIVNDFSGGATKAASAETVKTLKGLIDTLSINKISKVQKSVNADDYVDEFTAFESDGFNHGSAIWKILNEYNFENVEILLSLKTYKPISLDTTYYMLNNVSIKGVKQPYFANGLTHLKNGTIIQGCVTIVQPSSNLYFSDFGVDAGKDVTDLYYSGQGIEGMVLSVFPNDGGALWGNNINEKNLTMLCRTFDSPKHAHLIERFKTGSIDNIVTCFGIYGFVLKSQWINVGSVSSYSNQVDNVLIKSGEVYTVALANTFNSITTGILPPNITSSWVTSPKSMYGLYFEGGVPLSNVHINSALIVNADVAVSVSPILITGTVGSVHISNLEIVNSRIGLLKNSTGNVGDFYIGRFNAFNTSENVIDISGGNGNDFSIFINYFNTHGNTKSVNAIKVSESNLLQINNSQIADATNAFNISALGKLIVDNYELGVNITNEYAVSSIVLNRTNALKSDLANKSNTNTTNIFTEKQIFNKVTEFKNTIFINKGASDAIGVGSNFALANEGGDVQNIFQLNANGGISIYNYNTIRGEFKKTVEITAEGNIIAEPATSSSHLVSLGYVEDNFVRK